MLKRFLVLLLFCVSTTPALAADYTDIWYLPAESGWGVNVVQSDKFMFLTFFIYGPDGKPTWYTGQLTLDTSGNYTGPLVATSGTFYGSPWNSQQLGIATVGTASFQPTSVSTARLVYTVTTPAGMAANVTRNIQRQTLTSIPVAGSYIGGRTGTYSNCTNPGANGTYAYFNTMQVTQAGSSVTFQLTTDEGLQCTLAGTLTQTGQLMSVSNATYTCFDGRNTTATITELRATPLGLEGRWTSADAGGGCREDVTFGGTLR